MALIKTTEVFTYYLRIFLLLDSVHKNDRFPYSEQAVGQECRDSSCSTT
jgi:hypothetical protein